MTLDLPDGETPDLDDAAIDRILDPSRYDPNSRESVVVTDRASLAVALRRARLHARLSQRALAARAGVSTATVSRIEAETTDPTVSTLLRILTAAGVSLAVTGLGVPTFVFGVVERMRDAGGRHPAVHRLSDGGFGYWDTSTATALRRAASEHVTAVDMLAAMARARLDRARRGQHRRR